MTVAPELRTEVELLLPDVDEPDPEVSIVIPAVNEEITISHFVDWCQEGLRGGNVRGEILIVDSSTDRTAELARGRGARAGPPRGRERTPGPVDGRRFRLE